MIYLSSKWDTLDMEDLKGGLQIAITGCAEPPIVLAYAYNAERNYVFCEIFSVPNIKPGDLSEQPELVDAATNEQAAVDALNGCGDAGIYDILSDLAATGTTRGEHTKLIAADTLTTPLNNEKDIQSVQDLLQGTVRRHFGGDKG